MATHYDIGTLPDKVRKEYDRVLDFAAAYHTDGTPCPIKRPLLYSAALEARITGLEYRKLHEQLKADVQVEAKHRRAAYRAASN